MGKSAKLHKRPKNLKKASTSNTAAAVVSSGGAQAQAQNSRKKAGLKQKATPKGSESQGHVLGGADYVSLMMGGRKRAKAEAAKLPQEQ
ncbi:hypothetical protein FB45DRAFT_896503 [Roridomyces roridus]|uniref:Uncharacterized protein n=1 Tax=Roridomyces roridus TaxID=1738132 RepID=A0AAD7FXR7_9AGAR|nr:hypothetical protein FB45DRAFT_896503 [Roridomyces roridus]